MKTKEEKIFVGVGLAFIIYVLVNVPIMALIVLLSACLAGAILGNEICRLAARNEKVFTALKKAGILYGEFPNRRVGFLESWRMIFHALSGQTISWD